MTSGGLKSASPRSYSSMVLRAGIVLLLLAFVTGMILIIGVGSPSNPGWVQSHPRALDAVFVFVIPGCLIGAGLVTVSFARSSLRYYKARAERRQH